MPTNRRRRKSARISDVSDGIWNWLNDKPIRKDDLDARWEVLMLEGCHARARIDGKDKLLTLWQTVREQILAGWIVDHPGTRPSLWWELDAPRQPAGAHKGWWYDGTLVEPRRRTGGTGVAAWDGGFAIVPHFSYGLPTAWATFDKNDPPRFESEAAYLDRHALLAPGERKLLKEAAFEPVSGPIDVLVYGGITA
jgi:hypothetical protein